MNLHAKAFSYSMEPCVRILCVRAGTVELRVGRPLLLFFGAPRESCFFSAGLNSVMQDHARACAHACARTTSHSNGVVDAFLKVCMDYLVFLENGTLSLFV